MPYVMEWNRPAIASELQEIASVIGLAQADEVIPAIAALFARIGIPASLKALGLGEDRIDWVADQSCGIERLIQNNPRPIDRVGMRRLVAAAYAGDLALVH
jgi:alcohol dehydrogenase class IV